MANVSYILPELALMSNIYKMIDDCVIGEEAIKAKKETYLPKPNKGDASIENQNRYDSYLQRAVFYNVTKRTLFGLNGQVFMRAPIINLPEKLKPMEASVDGSISLMQLAKKLNTNVLSLGRGGLLTDYPAVDGPVSVSDAETKGIRPTITSYHPMSVINWNTKMRGALRILNLVVIKESYVSADDGFERQMLDQWRVLRLNENDVYTVEIWREKEKTMVPLETFVPTDANGDTFDFIPFTFVGSEDNDHNIDNPPMYDISILNIAHYRNSADYEESSFFVGQPTLVMTGLTEQWVEDVLKGKVYLGSRSSIPLPVDADAKLLQTAPNIMPFEAMAHKERQMVALGAKLIEPSTVQRTATEATMDKSAENSILSSSAKNVSLAIEQALRWSAKFVGANPDEVRFELPTEFDISAMSSEDRRQLMEEWQSGLLVFDEAREALRKSGYAKLDNKQAFETALKEKELRGENNNTNNSVVQGG